jgi:hypothetical protein
MMTGRPVRSPFAKEELRATYAGRGALATLEELRDEFAGALRKALEAGDTYAALLAIRSSRILRDDVPAIVLGVSAHAIVLAHDDRHDRIHVGTHSLESLATIELGHHLLLGALVLRFAPDSVEENPRCLFSPEGTVRIPYHLLDERHIYAIVRTLRSTANL